MRRARENVNGTWGGPPRMEAVVGELAQRLLEEPGLAFAVASALTAAEDLPGDVLRIAARLAHAATVEPFRRAAPTLPKGRPHRWHFEVRRTERAVALDRARLDEAHRRLLASPDPKDETAGLFEGATADRLTVALVKAREGRRKEKEQRLERGPEVTLHAPRLWAARALLKATNRPSAWTDAERLVKRTKATRSKRSE